MYIYEPLLLKLFPTIDQLTLAARYADVEQGRDIRPLMSILMRIATASPRLAGNILTRQTAINSLSWTVTGEDPDEAAAIKLRLKKIVSAILKNYLNAPLYGAFCIEVDYDTTSGEIFPFIKKIYKPIELEKDDSTLNLIEDLPGGRLSRTSISSKAAQNFIYAIDEKSWIGGILRSVMYHEVLKNQTIQEWATFNRKLKGLIQAKAEDADKADAGDALRTFIQDQYAVTSKDVEFIFNELTSSKAVDSFEKFRDGLNNDVSISILGQANTSELPKQGGSRAALQIMQLISADILYSDLLSLKGIIDSQLLMYDYQLNVDKKAKASPYEFSFIFDEAQDVEGNARMLEIAARMGVPIVKSDAYKKLALQVPTDTDELLELNTNTAAPQV